MKNNKVIETVVVTFDEFNDPEFWPPSKYCFRNYDGDYVFIITQKRAVAQDTLKQLHGDMFKLREV
jgi:hypothetical protein